MRHGNLCYWREKEKQSFLKKMAFCYNSLDFVYIFKSSVFSSWLYLIAIVISSDVLINAFHTWSLHFFLREFEYQSWDNSMFYFHLIAAFNVSYFTRLPILRKYTRLVPLVWRSNKLDRINNILIRRARLKKKIINLTTYLSNTFIELWPFG